VTNIVVLCAVGPAKQDGHHNSKPVKGSTIDGTMHVDFRLVATRVNITSAPVRYKWVIVRGVAEGCPPSIADRKSLGEGLTSPRAL
jgi:hypothetical protein